MSATQFLTMFSLIEPSNSTFEQRFYLFDMRRAQAAILEIYRWASITMSGMRPISELLYLGRYYKNVGKSW